MANYLFVASVIFVVCFQYTSAKSVFPSDDPTLQAKLDQLISEALDRDLSQNPNKEEYERYYKVRKFVMDHSGIPATTEAPVFRKPMKSVFPSNDPVLQGKLDKLIEAALDRDHSQNPNKEEYERYYKVRKFVMDHSY